MDTVHGIVFNIQRFSIHDGPGIRTTVFVKGCPLRCLWCHNPESNRVQKELMYYETLCTACGACVSACPQKLLSLDGQRITRSDGCTACGKCVDVCQSKAREIMGNIRTVDEVLKEAMKDEKFYLHSGGGVTVSGGEPLSQPEFAAALLEKCKENGVNTCIETCGFAPRKALDTVMQHTDLVLYDIKHLDARRHRELTGVSNESILDNLRHIAIDLKKKIWLRMPLISGINDDCGLIRKTAEFALPFAAQVDGVYLLPYHTLGISKLQALGRSYEQCADFAPPTQEHLQELAAIWEKYGFKTHIN